MANQHIHTIVLPSVGTIPDTDDQTAGQVNITPIVADATHVAIDGPDVQMALDEVSEYIKDRPTLGVMNTAFTNYANAFNASQDAQNTQIGNLQNGQTAAANVLTAHDASIVALNASQASQDTHLTALDASQVVQDNKITALQGASGASANAGNDIVIGTDGKVYLKEAETTVDSFALSGNSLVIKYTGETGVQQVKSVDLTPFTADINLASGVLDNPSAGVYNLILTDTDGSTVTVNLASLLAVVTANSTTVSFTGDGTPANPLTAMVIMAVQSDIDTGIETTLPISTFDLANEIQSNRYKSGTGVFDGGSLYDVTLPFFSGTFTDQQRFYVNFDTDSPDLLTPNTVCFLNVNGIGKKEIGVLIGDGTIFRKIKRNDILNKVTQQVAYSSILDMYFLETPAEQLPPLVYVTNSPTADITGDGTVGNPLYVDVRQQNAMQVPITTPITIDTTVNPSSTPVQTLLQQIGAWITNFKNKARPWVKSGSTSATNNDNVSVSDDVFHLGKVGVGTNAPVEALQVIGNQYLDGILKFPFSATRNYIEVNGLQFLHTPYSLLNTGVGANAINKNTTGSYNTAVGNNNMSSLGSGNFNTGVGTNNLLSLVSGSGNTAVGMNALYYSVSGINNTAIGLNALIYNTIGNNNIAIGDASLFYNAVGLNNTAIGTNALFYNTGSGNVALGFTSGRNETGDNKLYIENSSTVTPLIGGDFATNKVNIRTLVGSGGGMLNVGGAIEATAFNVVSDERTKDILGKVDANGASKRLRKLAKNSWRWTYQKGVFSDDFENAEQVGYTAQVYQELYPNAVQDGKMIRHDAVKEFEREMALISDKIKVQSDLIEQEKVNKEESLKLAKNDKEKSKIESSFEKFESNLKEDIIKPLQDSMVEMRGNIKEEPTLKITDSYKSIIVDLVLMNQQLMNRIEALEGVAKKAKI